MKVTYIRDRQVKQRLRQEIASLADELRIPQPWTTTTPGTSPNEPAVRGSQTPRTAFPREAAHPDCKGASARPPAH